MRFTKGFTLIELLVVIAIIGILAGVVVISLSGNTESADDTITKANLRSIIPLHGELYADSKIGRGNTSLCKDSRVQAVMDGLLGSSGTFHAVAAFTRNTTSIPAQDQYVATTTGLTLTDLTGCVSTADSYVVWAELDAAGKMWCYDSVGEGKEVSARSRNSVFTLEDAWRVVQGDDTKRSMPDIDCTSVGT